MFAFLSGSFVLASRASAEQPSRKFAPVDGAVGTQDTALQIAWTNSKLQLLVCSCRRPGTSPSITSRSDFLLTALGFALQRLAADRIRAPDLRLRRQDGAYAHPRYALTDAA
jgi:hypothetical protein